MGTFDAAALEETLSEDDPTAALTNLFASPDGRAALPEVAALHMPDGHGLHKDNLTHTFQVVRQAPNRLRVRLAALFHDVGKPPTRVIANGKVTFHDHEAVGARLTRKRLTALGFDKALASEVAELVRISGRTHGFDGNWTDSAVRRFVHDAGDLYTDALDLARADCTSKHADRRKRARQKVDAFHARAQAIAANDAKRAIRPPIDGNRIAELLGLSGQKGPAMKPVGDAYRMLVARAEAGENLTAQEAEAAVLAWHHG